MLACNSSLIKEVKDGSVDAFSQVYNLYSKRVFLFTRNYLNSNQDAEEIVQDVFLRLWEKRDELLTSKSFESYLFTITKNAVLNTIRKSRHEKAYIEYKRLNSDKHVLLDEELNFKELEKLYKRAIDQLSHRRKEIFILSREHSLSYTEIARELNISVKTVENQMNSALSEIRNFVQGSGVTGMLILLLYLN